MNIFILDKNHEKNAQYHVDKHVVKMITEYNQLLCGAHYFTTPQISNIPYKLTHKNHPCSLWVRKSINNYLWLCDLNLELCKEYTYRYKKIHKGEGILKWCYENLPSLPDIPQTTFTLIMPLNSQTNCPIISYRNYYLNEKKHLFTWKNREIPEWILKKS